MRMTRGHLETAVSNLIGIFCKHEEYNLFVEVLCINEPLYLMQHFERQSKYVKKNGQEMKIWEHISQIIYDV